MSEAALEGDRAYQLAIRAEPYTIGPRKGQEDFWILRCQYMGCGKFVKSTDIEDSPDGVGYRAHEEGWDIRGGNAFCQEHVIMILMRPGRMVFFYPWEGRRR